MTRAAAKIVRDHVGNAISGGLDRVLEFCEICPPLPQGGWAVTQEGFSLVLKQSRDSSTALVLSLWTPAALGINWDSPEV